MEGGICPENVPQVLSSVQSLSHVQLCDPMNRSTPALVLEDPLEKEMAAQSSILAWKIPWTVEPGKLQSMGSQTVRHN